MRAIPTVLLAGYRGFLLDLCATRDRKRISRAVDLWIAALDRFLPLRAFPMNASADGLPRRQAALIFIFATVALDMIALGVIASVFMPLVAVSSRRRAARRGVGTAFALMQSGGRRFWACCGIGSDAGRSSCCRISGSPLTRSCWRSRRTSRGC
jgi:hypothetical protein